MIKKSEHITEEFENLRNQVQKRPPFKGMTKPQIIAELRKSRAKLWRERIEDRSRHQ